MGGERYPQKTRQEAIRLYADEELSAAAVAARLGLKAFTVKEWVLTAGVIRTMSEAAAISVARKPRTRATSRLWHTSKKTGVRNFAESSLEFLRMDQLDADATVLSWARCRFRVAYVAPCGKVKNYIPDLIVTFADGSRRIEELKPQSLIGVPINVAKFCAAERFCADNDMTFVVLTEVDVGYVRAMAPTALSRQERRQRHNELRTKRRANETAAQRADRLKKQATYMRKYNADRRKRDLPVGAFSESGTNVSTSVLTIRKAE